MANAQDAETVVYKVNTHENVQSLRLTAVNSQDKEPTLSSPIGSVCDSIVFLHLNPLSDYELLVNNTVRIEISSDDIQESFAPKDLFSPSSFVATESAMVRED